jgi:SOS-response transcriptional repressor LexA
MVPAMKTAGDRLKWARESASYDSAAEFARAHGIGEGGYRHHENGTRPIHVHVAKKYSTILGIDAAWLLTGQGRPRPGTDLLPNGKPLRLAPVISWVQAGSFGSADMDLSLENAVPVPTNAKRIAAVEVLGTSMNRVAPPGSFIVLDYDDVSPRDGLLYIARIGDELTFKRFRDTSGPTRLEPDSTEPHDTIYPAEEWAIVARVIWIARSV